MVSSCAVPETVIGVQDSRLGQRIERLNATRTAYDRHDYTAIERLLNGELDKADSGSARQHLLNELADLYSFHILDIERAVVTDQKLQEIGAVQNAGYGFIVNAADNRILVDHVYRDRYVNAPNDRILADSRRRLDRNQTLLSGAVPRPSEGYDRARLERLRTDVVADIQRTHSGTPDRKRIISRLIRIEYELYRVTSDPRVIGDGHRRAQAEGMGRRDFYFEEIDFLSLSDYFSVAFSNGGPVNLAERSLEIIFLPYSLLREERSRLLYNQRVNSYIETLIDANHRAGHHGETLYYASLNKSRMILEDRVARTRSAIADVAHSAIASDPATGLPDKAAFMTKLGGIDDFVDFYASADDRLIVSRIERGTVTARRLDRETVARIRTALEAERLRVMRDGRSKPNRGLESVDTDGGAVSLPRVVLPASAGDAPAPGLSEAIRQLLPPTAGRTLTGRMPVLSPDKWLAPHPLGYLLGVPEHRALSVLDYGNRAALGSLDLVGYFDPEGNLPDARDEMPIIRSRLPNARLFAGSEASLATLRQPLLRNILHLSMHGVYDYQDPTASRLMFAGSARQGNAGIEPGALLARDMDAYDQLKDNDLVFTAACETGQFDGDQKNQSEIIGILRPLLINNNRNIILTLWSVDSATAGEFVREFYKSLADTRNVITAFDNAQKQLQARYPDRPYLWSPYYLIQNG